MFDQLSNQSKNYLIIFLLIVLAFSVIGIDILNKTGGGLQKIFNAIFGFFQQILGILGFATGSVINVTTDVVADGARYGIDITEGSLQSAGNLLQKASSGSVVTAQNNIRMNNNDTSDSIIQNPISSKKTKWCLVGEYKGKRGCIEVDKSDECLSGTDFPSEQVCMDSN